MSFHDPGMTRGSRWMGLAMAAGSMILLLDAPKDFSPWHFVWFLVFFVGGLMLAGGFLLLPSRAEPAKAAAVGTREAPRDGGGTFLVRPPTHPVPFALAGMGAGGLFILGLYLAVAGARLLRVGPVDLIPIAGIPLVSGAGLLAYLWRHRSVTIAVDDAGLRGRGYWRRVDAPWCDVRALSRRSVWYPGGPAQVHRVVTGSGTITFYSTWPGSAELADAIAARSGLEWQGLGGGAKPGPRGGRR